MYSFSPRASTGFETCLKSIVYVGEQYEVIIIHYPSSIIGTHDRRQNKKAEITAQKDVSTTTEIAGQKTYEKTIVERKFDEKNMEGSAETKVRHEKTRIER